MHKECPECGRRLGHKMDCSGGVMEDHGTSSERGIVGKAEHHATLIRAAITAARADGVNVNLDWSEDEDGIHVQLDTTIHRRLPSDDGEVMIMRIVEGPCIVEGH